MLLRTSGSPTAPPPAWGVVDDDAFAVDICVHRYSVLDSRGDCAAPPPPHVVGVDGFAASTAAADCGGKLQTEAAAFEAAPADPPARRRRLGVILLVGILVEHLRSKCCCVNTKISQWKKRREGKRPPAR
jgi:hypothetical protein